MKPQLKPPKRLQNISIVTVSAMLICYFWAQILLAQNLYVDLGALIDAITIEEKTWQLDLTPIEVQPTIEQLALTRRGLVGCVLKAHDAEFNNSLERIAINENLFGTQIVLQENRVYCVKTIALVPMAESATWDLKTIRKSAAVATSEAASAGFPYLTHR